MTVTREVILDLMPLYLAGEASPASRVLVEEYMKGDAELAQAIRSKWAENLSKVTNGGVPAELELQSLRRAKQVIAWQKWLFGCGIFFTASAFSFVAEIRNWQVEEFHFLMEKSPLTMATFVALGVGCWLGYGRLRNQLR